MVDWTDRPGLGPKHIEERLKLAANGLQAVSITLLAGAVLALELNASLTAPLWSKIAAGAVAGLSELALQAPRLYSDSAEGSNAMRDMLFNLAVFVASAAVAVGLGNLVWRMVTHERNPHHPAE